MEARRIRPAVIAAVLLVSMGARFRTPNFIIDTSDPNMARQFGAAAEKHRRELAVAWLGKTMPNWSQPCPITIHVGPRLGAGGATSFVFDRGEVFGWRMTIQGSRERILDSVLPHEITHMIFASHFREPLPRWADEGGATSVEGASERNRHRQMLYRFLRTGRGIAFGRMFAMTQYPRDIMPLYAQGYSLAEYLIGHGGRPKYLAFLGDGMKTDNWTAAIKRHYGISDVGALQNTWLAWVRQGCPQTKPRQEHPAAGPKPEMLAAKRRPARPAPNLIYHVRDKERPSQAPRRLVAVQPAAHVNSRPGVKQLPSSGWYAAGGRPSRPAATAVAQPSTAAPVRSQVAHPQPIRRPRQTILEWSGKQRVWR